MTSSATINGIAVVSVKRMARWRGAWVAEVDVDPDAVALAPTSGPVVLSIGLPPRPVTTLKGTIDPRYSGAFGGVVRLLVVGGGGGWDKPVPAQDYNNDGGIVSTQIYAGAGALVGEVVNTIVPAFLGTRFTRSDGPASRVLDDVDWWVDELGVTQVGPRPPAIADATLELLSWDPIEQRGEIACDALVLPGTVLTDPRIGTTPVTVRDVDQTFGPSGARATVWCATAPTSRLLDTLKSIIREFAETTFLKSYVYRVVLQDDDGRLQLQVVDSTSGVPVAMLPVTVWSGMAGDSAKVAGGTEVLVEFTAGDKTQATVRAFDDTLPLERTVDATALVHLGPSAAKVALAGGIIPVALATPLVAFLTALQTWSAAVASALSSAGFPIVAPQGALVTAIGTAKNATPAAKTVAA